VENNKNIKKMIFCLDSDKEGHFFSGKIKERFGKKYEILKYVFKKKN